MSTAFAYPPQPHERRHGPQGYADAASYRPWLRDEFSFRCVYCLLREQWGRAQATFDVEHFRPVATNPELATTYANLGYACTTCNVAKRTAILPDPCAALSEQSVRVHEDGRIEGVTPEGLRIIRVLGLDSPRCREFRLMWIGIVALAERHEPDLFLRLMGFPDDLPDLAPLNPPGGNQRPVGIQGSFHAQRAAGQLPPTY